MAGFIPEAAWIGLALRRTLCVCVCVYVRRRLARLEYVHIVFAYRFG